MGWYSTVRNDTLIKLIDNLTLEIIEKIQGDEFDKLAALFNKRLDCIKELVSSASTEEDKKILVQYLVAFQVNDQLLADVMNKENHHLQEILLNIQKIKQYSKNL